VIRNSSLLSCLLRFLGSYPYGVTRVRSTPWMSPDCPSYSLHSVLSPVCSVLRKEVIQPQLPLQLPCYDFVPVTGPALDGCSLAVSPPASGVTSSHDVTGGVYKARERIHRTMADARLLATPTSCGRVAAHNPNCDRLCAIGSGSPLGNALYRPL
jgi:hypothetical protein